MCGIAGRVMTVGRVPLKRAERVPGPPNPSPALPATPVQHPGLEHLRPPPCMGAFRGAMGASQVSNWEYRILSKRPSGWGPRRLTLQVVLKAFPLFLMVSFLSIDPGTMPRAPSHFSRLPLGGWAEDGQPASRHPEPVPEEGSEDELPPQVHKVKAVRQEPRPQMVTFSEDSVSCK